MSADTCTICLISPDAGLRDAVRAAMSGMRQTQIHLVPRAIDEAETAAEAEAASLVVADIDATRREHLLALQKLMIRLGGRVPVIVLTEAFDEAVGRWFLQIRVSDFLRKPIRPDELLRACLKVLRTERQTPEMCARVLAFVAAAGGVGNTTLAVEAAMQLQRAGAANGQSTCLVDLDFHNDACADFLDLQPQLNLDEIGPSGERLDSQLMEVMLARHESGVLLLAAPGRPAEPSRIEPAAVVRLLEIAAARFDNVVLDVPRTWFGWTDDVLAGADRIFVVTDMTVPGLRAARRLAARIDERLNCAAAARVIVNRFQSGMLFGGGLRRADVERALGGSFIGSVSNNYQVVREAIDRGVGLEVVKPGNNVTADLKRILLSAAA
jgi:pilus assembly protein CpaE